MITKIKNIPKSHPESSLNRVSRTDTDSPVIWIWSGGLTSASIRIKLMVASHVDRVSLYVSTSRDLSNSRVYEYETVEDILDYRIMNFNLQDLEPGRSYFYIPVINGEKYDSHAGRFRTPQNGAVSFTFAFASCARTGSNGEVFDTILSNKPLFFMHLGDFHYENISRNNVWPYLDAYMKVLTAPAQAQLYRNVPVVYMWDDHDYGPNDSDRQSKSRYAAAYAYRQCAPHYPLAAHGDKIPIYQSFAIGRVFFILTDLRSQRAPVRYPDGPAKTMMGSKQKKWFKDTLLSIKDEYALIVWGSTVPWIGPPEMDSDSWNGYDHERREISAFLEKNSITNLIVLSGDAHMLALDDGSNNCYGPSGKPSFPCMVAAALDRSGRLQGGPYSHGSIKGGGHFGLMTVEDSGENTIKIILSGRNFKNEELLGTTLYLDVHDKILSAINTDTNETIIE